MPCATTHAIFLTNWRAFLQHYAFWHPSHAVYSFNGKFPSEGKRKKEKINWNHQFSTMGSPLSKEHNLGGPTVIVKCGRTYFLQVQNNEWYKCQRKVKRKCLLECGWCCLPIVRQARLRVRMDYTTRNNGGKFL